MKNLELFSETLKIVAETTDIPTQTIMSGAKQTEVVDARTIIIMTLADAGLYPNQIAALMRMTASNVRYILTRRKTSKQLKNNYLRTANKLKTSCEQAFTRPINID